MSGPVSANHDADSEYGSEFDEDGEAQLRHLVEFIEAGRLLPSRHPALQNGADSSFPNAPVSQDGPAGIDEESAQSRLVQIELDDIVAAPATSPSAESPGRIKWETGDSYGDAADGRSPLERFRTAPKKPLSVTDFVSPAWCELQYWYHLTTYGRVKQTPAMKRGSKVHKGLEEEVHLTTPVDVQTREDAWAIRLWNVIQGLRTLRTTGLTREFEVWGLVDGQVINGIIDELSFTCTDDGLENDIEKLEVTSGQGEVTPYQTSTTQLSTAGYGNETSSKPTSTRDAFAGARKIYLTDVKTRSSRVLPNAVAMRPTRLQLMLYRRLLTDMASNAVDAKVVFGRYNLRHSERFSDSLIAQLGALDMNSHPRSTQESQALIGSNIDTLTELLAHNSLARLWSLMLDEFRETIPHSPTGISKVLRAEFRSSTDGSIIGSKTFPYEEEQILRHMSEEMQWWRGERSPRGVNVEEAFKCRSCHFAPQCTWRLGKIEDAISASRRRAAARIESAG